MDKNHYAILIDGDNISPHYASDIIDLIKKRGKIILKRVYGDFSQDNMKNWAKNSMKYSIEPMQVWRVNGKQSSDIKITADCMQMLLTKDLVHHFVIVSGDSDFTILINKIKAEGKNVIGISVTKQSTSVCLKYCCDEFIYLDKLKKEDDSNGDSKDMLEAYLIEIFTNLDDSLIMLSQLKEKLLAYDSSFNECNYGYKNFGSLINSFKNLEIVRSERGTLFVKYLEGAK